MAHKSKDDAAAQDSPLVAAIKASVPPTGIEVGAPTRLIDIDLFRFGIVRHSIWGPQGGPQQVRSITLDEAGAKKLMHEFVKALI